MDTKTEVAQKIRQLKHQQTDTERLYAWQQTRTQNGLSGEFALAAKLGESAATEEQIKWIAEMYGR